MRFAEPGWLLLGVPFGLALAAGLWRDHLARKRLARFADSTQWIRLGLGPGSLRRVRVALGWAAAAWAILALARPQLGSRTEVQRTEAIDLVLVLDLSRSMRVEDIAPSRLARARLEAERLIELLPGQRVGLVGYTSVALPLSPLTVDGRHLRLQLERAEPELMPRGGTRLAEGIEMALQMLQNVQSEAERAMVVFTDAEDHGGGAEQAAREAREAGVRVHVVALGTAKGLPIPEPGDAGSFVRDARGRAVLTRLDPEAARQVAEAGGGLAVVSDDGRIDLEPLRAALSAMNKAELGVRRRTVYTERYRWALFPALLCLAAAFAVRPFRRQGAAWTAAWALLCGAPSAAAAPEGPASERRVDGELASFEAAHRTRGLPETRLNLGLAQARAGRVEDAEQTLRQAESSGPPSLRARASFALGNLLRRQGRLEPAEAAYRRALLRDPNLDGARKNLLITRALNREDPPPESDAQPPPDPPPESGSSTNEPEPEPGADSSRDPESSSRDAGGSRSEEGSNGKEPPDGPDGSGPTGSDSQPPSAEDSERRDPASEPEPRAEEGATGDAPDEPSSSKRDEASRGVDRSEATEANEAGVESATEDGTPEPGVPGAAAGPDGETSTDADRAVQALLEGLRQQERSLWKRVLQRKARRSKEPVRKDW